MYHVDFEKRGGCGMVARERHESHMSQRGELLAKPEQLKIFPLLKILAVDKNNSHFNCADPMRNRELLKKAIYHGNQLMGASLMKNFLFVFIPESVRYFFNLTTYPRETDTFLSRRVEKLLVII